MHGAIRVVVAVVASGLLLSCGGGSATTTSTADDTVTFVGRPLPGTLYITAGPQEENADLYEVNGDFSEARRRSRNGRFSVFSVSGDGVMVASVAPNGPDQVEVIDLADPADVLPGTAVDPEGQLPDISPSGMLAWTRVTGQTDEGGTAVLTSPNPTGRPRRVAYEAEGGDVSSFWGPNDELGVIVGEVDRKGQRQSLILSPNTPQERRVSPKVGSIIYAETNSGNEMFVIGDTGRLVVYRPDGSERIRATIPKWFPSWSPDPGLLLLAKADALGTLNLNTGRIREVARVGGGVISQARWVTSKTK